MNFSGMRVAVAGMGVSGLALGRAIRELGGEPVVFDEKQNDHPSIMSAVDKLDSYGVPAVTGWHGRLDPQEFDLLVVSPGFPQGHPSIRDMVSNGKDVWSEVEFAYRVSKAPILAVTGTNGKSTTSVLLWLLLRGAGESAVLCGNIAGSGYPETTLTEAALRSNQTDFLIAEVSSYQLEWVSKFRPKVAAVTNITPDHMDRYKLFSDYFNTKLNIFSEMGHGDFVVINGDEPSVSMQAVTDNVSDLASIVTFSPSGTVPATGVTARNGVHLELSGFPLNLNDLPLYGEHNVTNAMMAWEMAACVTAPNDGMVQALRDFKGLDNRMERLGEKNGTVIVNNSMCTNPAAVIASSQSVGQRQHLLMGGVTKNLDFGVVGEYLQNTDHKVYVFGPGAEHMITMLGYQWPTFPSLEAAFGAATQSAKPGETILLSPGCASAEPYANFKERGEAFRAMVRDWLDR